MESKAKNEDIEVLRAVAVSCTILAHLYDLVVWRGDWTGLFAWVNFWGGVDLFFCISGFVIASSLLRQKHSGRFRDFAAAFYIRRIFRIWPAALLWLLIPLLASRYFNWSGAFGHFRTVLLDATAAALQVANIYFMVCTGPCGKEAIYWSLSLEEQFYLLFPLLLFFMPRHLLRYVLVALIVLQFPLHRPEDSPFWLVRTDAICYGVLLAMAHQEGLLAKLPFGAIFNRRIAGAVALVLIVAIAVISITAALWVNAGLLAATSAGLVLLASYDRNIIIPWRRTRPLLLWAGSRSYSLYLVHNPCFWAVRELCRRLYPAAHPDHVFVFNVIVTALVLSLIASEGTFRWVETPLRKMGRRIAERYEGAALATPASPGLERTAADGPQA